MTSLQVSNWIQVVVSSCSDFMFSNVSCSGVGAQGWQERQQPALQIRLVHGTTQLYHKYALSWPVSTLSSSPAGPGACK